MRFVPVLLALALMASAQVRFEPKSDRVDVSIDGQPFGSLHFGKEAHKPFFHPLRSASGKEVSRGFPLSPQPGELTDHPHQKGLWTGTERLSGMDFWENDPSYKRPRMGNIVFKDLTRLNAKSGQLAFTADWISPENQLVVTQEQAFTFHSGDKNVRLIDVDITLTARQAVTFEDHQDAVLGVRLGKAFEERNGGIATNAEGLRGEAGVRGKPSPWVDWTATVDNEKLGVAIFDHPGNLFSPARWHLRAFGILIVNPFARREFDPKAPSAEKSLQPDETIRLKYRVVIHSDNFNLKAAYATFARTPHLP